MTIPWGWNMVASHIVLQMQTFMAGIKESQANHAFGCGIKIRIIISHDVVASCLLIRYSVPRWHRQLLSAFYRHLGVPMARLHGCLPYHIPKGIFHLFSLSISCFTNQENPLIPFFIVNNNKLNFCFYSNCC